MISRFQASFLIVASAVGVFAHSHAFATTGADVLLRTVAPAAQAQPAQSTKGTGNKAVDASPAAQAAMTTGLKLDNPFAVQLFASWQAERQLPYEINTWVLKVLKEDFTGAAHLWTVVQEKTPGSFTHAARAAWLYSLYRLDLAQSFIDEWIQAQQNPNFSASRDAAALDQVVGQNFTRYLFDRGIYLTPEQQAVVKKFDRNKGPHVLSLVAYASLRSGVQAQEIAPLLPMDHPYKIPLAQTAALAMVKKGDLAGAAQFMKAQLEPAIEAKKDPLALSNHYLQVARLLYQAGVLDSAEEFYLKIPNSAPEFVKAREELTWVLLRKSDHSRLRGELVTLSSPLFKEKFAPELYMVRAISNLKLCFYDAVQKDFVSFMNTNSIWARKIDAALKANEAPAPANLDFFSTQISKVIDSKAKETQELATLAEDSIRAVLPAVGAQAHWVRLKNSLQQKSEMAVKTRQAEYRRQWKNMQGELQESIRKMQFVRVELMSQLADLQQIQTQKLAETSGKDAVAASSAAPARSEAVKIATQRGEVGFAFDGVLWPDEFFKVRSAAQERCIQLRGNL
jgi:hypothetical protein